MFDRIIVPTDGSDGAWRGVMVGDRLAAQCGGVIELVHVFVDADDADVVKGGLEYRIGLESLVSAPLVTVLPLQHTVARTIAQYAAPTGGDQIVMSSSGHGRSAAFLGNVATDLIVEHAGPVVVVGPAATRPKRSLRGELVVAVDGSNVDEAVLGVAADWAPRLGQRPWVVTVVDRVAPLAVDGPGKASPRELAHRLSTATGHPVESDTLQGRRPAAAIVEFADSIDASLILLGTHERTGLARLAVGSVAAAVVRHARCPVVLADPAHPRVLSMTAATPVGSAARSRADGQSDAAQADHGRGVL